MIRAGLSGSRDLPHLICIIAPGCPRWKWPALHAIQLDCLIDYLAQFLEDRLFVIAMGPAVNQTRRAAHIAMILLRPLDNFCIPGAVFHFLDCGLHGPKLVFFCVIG